MLSTPLNDVDVIYFDVSDVSTQTEQDYERTLSAMMPAHNWQVRNQARMHLQNGDTPYADCIDAMGYWPEKETAVAVRKVDGNGFECVSAFGFDILFAHTVTHNPKRDIAIFKHRVESKQWLTRWIRLRVKA
jgi:hypothetical protein